MLDCEVVFGVCGYSLLCFWGTVCMSVCEVTPNSADTRATAGFFVFVFGGTSQATTSPSIRRPRGLPQSPPPIQETLPKAARVSADPRAASQTNIQDFLFLRRSCMCLRLGFFPLFGDFLPKDGHRQTHTHTDTSAFCACPMRHGGALRDCGAEAGRAGSWPAVFVGLRAPVKGRALNRSPAESYWVERPKSALGWFGGFILFREKLCFEWVDVETAKRNSDIQPQSQRPKCQTSPRKESDITARRVRHRSTESQTS